MSDQYLQDVLDGKADLAHAPEELKALVEAGYLSDHHVSEIEHPSTNYLHDFLDDHLGFLCLQVTQGCNLRCEYCIYSEQNNEKQRTHSNRNMSEEVARKAVDYLYEHSASSESIAVAFYGGEPLLNYPLIQKMVAYVEEQFEGKTLLFTMTTNATLLTADKADYLVKHNFNLTLSVDGPKQIHDKHRRTKTEGSFDRMIQNVSYIANTYPEYWKRSVHISMVIDPGNDYDEINSLFNEYPMFRQTQRLATEVDNTYADEPLLPSARYMQETAYQSFLANLGLMRRIPEEKLSPISFDSAKRLLSDKNEMLPQSALPDKAAPGGPCVAGYRRLFCDIEGNFFPCERVSELSPINHIGNVYDGINIDSVRKVINVAQTTEEQCRNCWAFMKCTQCIRTSDGGNQIDRDLRLAQCAGVRNSFEYCLYYYLMLKEIEFIYRG